MRGAKQLLDVIVFSVTVTFLLTSFLGNESDRFLLPNSFIQPYRTAES